MKVVNFSRQKFKQLEKLKLAKHIMNTESEIYMIPSKDKWNKNITVLKKYYIDEGEVFSNKLYTLNALLERKVHINNDSLVMPTALAAINNQIVGFTMPYIPNINLKTALNSSRISNQEKIDYLKQIGNLLEELKYVRSFTKINNFYLNDLHENNFIIGLEDKKVYTVDLDSSKIGINLTQPSKYLCTTNQIGDIVKYKKITDPDDNIGGIYKVSEETELYCYMMIILNFLYNGNVAKLSKADFFTYLNYLSSIGVSNRILEKFSYIYTPHKNENPVEYLDDLVPYYGRSSKAVFEYIRKKKKY